MIAGFDDHDVFATKHNAIHGAAQGVVDLGLFSLSRCLFFLFRAVPCKFGRSVFDRIP